MRLRCWSRCWPWLAAVVLCTQASAAPLQPCRLRGVVHEALCGHVQRPLDPAQPQGVQIDVHFAVLPALARNKLPDPVFFIAGGPGQSAIELAGPVAAQLGRLGNRRDLVFVDQRGTGRSAPLRCASDVEEALRPLAQRLDPSLQITQAQQCAQRLSLLPHGDLRHYTTPIAMADLDAVRSALGAPQINLVGASYGTRAALDYMRQFPQAVRRAVLDGVAPADMVLPSSFSADNQSALNELFDGCARDAMCLQQFPRVREQWSDLLASLPRSAEVSHPVSGRVERVTLTRDAVLGLVRTPLYVPALASGLPAAIAQAARGRFEALLGLATALSNPNAVLYTGMHLSVVCAEDVPRLAQAIDVVGAQFGDSFARLYEQVCALWPKPAVLPPAFYTTPNAPAATWVLSGAVDPATPPRHGARVAGALGPKARHTVVPNAGHGVMSLLCVRDAVLKFIEAKDDDAALLIDAHCAAGLPRPPVFVPLGGAP